MWRYTPVISGHDSHGHGLVLCAHGLGTEQYF
jgi:hypothetical protein